MKTNLNWSYIAGLIESDGSIQCFIDKQTSNLKYIVKITSKTNTNTLKNVTNFLKENGITATEEITDDETIDDETSNRAPSIRIQGNDQVVLFLTKLIENSKFTADSKYPLLGVKLRNLLLILNLPNQSTLTTVQKIDIKKTFHKENYEQEDIDKGPSYSRNKYENNNNLKNNSSKNAAKQLIKKVDSLYNEHLKEIKSFSGKLNNDYVVGLFDGDGGFNISFSLKKTDGIVEIVNEINLTLPLSDVHIFAMLLTHFGLGLNEVSIQKKSTSEQLKIRKQTSVQIMIDFFNKYPLLGDHKSKGLELIKEVVSKKQNKFFQKNKVDLEEFKILVQKIYNFSNNGRKPIQEIFEFIDTYYIDIKKDIEKEIT